MALAEGPRPSIWRAIQEQSAAPSGGRRGFMKRPSLDEMNDSERVARRALWSKRRQRIADILESRLYELIMAAIIVINAGLIIYETDRRAQTPDLEWWQHGVDLCFLAFYTADVVLHMYIYRLLFFTSPWGCLDLFVVLSDLASLVLSQIIGNVPSFAFLRVCRIFRLVRFAHILELFRELHLMLTGFISAMRAMFWASVMLIVMLTLWSIIAVEVLHPINVRIAETGYYGDCDRCTRAFSSVFAANLTFLQQIIAGDSWGMVSIPIIEEAPATIVIFFAVLVTVNLGLLNLILTVIVDVAHAAREADELNRIAEKTREFESAKRKLFTLCEELDVNKSGELTYEELMVGMETNPRFSTTMASMEVVPEDMHIIFSMLDEDNSGSISYGEFVEQLHKLKSQDTHTMLIFIRGFLKDVRTKVKDHLEITKSQIGVRTEELVRDMKKILYGSSLPIESALHVKIEGARGLRTDEAIGSSDPYCSCEVVGKPDTKTKSHLVEDSLDPDWQFEDVIEGYALGDSLAFTVWGRDALQDEYCLGTAVLTTEEIVRSKSGFEGELKLHHSGEHSASLKVKVSSQTLSSDPTCPRHIEHVKGAGTSLCSIEGQLQQVVHQMQNEFAQVIPAITVSESESKKMVEGDLKQFAQRLEDELSELRKDMASKADEQIGILRGCNLVAQALDLGNGTTSRKRCAAGEDSGRDVDIKGKVVKGKDGLDPLKVSRM